MRRLEEGLKDAAARLCVLPLVLAPVANPDVFWHLNVAARMLAEGRLPRDEAFSFTRLGAPWVDFEWLFELAALGFHRLGGWAALWGFKALLWALQAALVEALGRLSGGRGRGRLLLVLWCAASLSRAELKPELFSAALFLAELWLLEACERGRLAAPGWRAAGAAGAVFFAAWANLHAGFAAGLFLLLVYAVLGSRESRPAAAAALAAGAAATLANPYGAGVWTVVAEHARSGGLLARSILEWGPLTARNGYHVPQLLLLAAAAAAAVAAAMLGKPGAPASLASAGLFGTAGLLHARAMTYAVAPVGLVLLESSAALAGLLSCPERWRRAGAAAGAATAVAFLAWLGGRDAWPPRAFDWRLFPVGAVDFVARERAALLHRRVYNEWGWGGYLAWRLGDEQRVFYDGRYLFHPLLAEEKKAEVSPSAWEAFLDAYGVEWALIMDRPRPVPLARGAGTIEHYRLYFPDSAWALLYVDGLARVYVRRAAFDPAWVAARDVYGRPPRRRA